MKQTKISNIKEVIIAILANCTQFTSILYSMYSTYTNSIFQNSIESRVSKLESEKLIKKKTFFEPQVIIFTSFKGGVGVSSLTTLFCNHISNQYNILLIDAHPQLSCYNMRKNDLATTPEIKPLYEIEAVAAEELASHLDIIKDKYDFIVIDLPRFFYYKDNLESVFIKSNHVFALFHIPYMHWTEEYTNNYYNLVDGRLDLFINLQKKIKDINKDITFTLIPYENDVTDNFKDWIECFGIFLLQQTFKRYSELQSQIDTITDLCQNHDIAYAPYIIDTQKVIYYLEKATNANDYIEEQNNLARKKIENILNLYKK